MMANVIKKTNLGIAVQQTIDQLGLERQKKNIMNCLQRAFEENYEEFKRSMSSTSLPLKGNYVSDNEYPIGQGDKQQHFRCVAYNSKLNNSTLNIHYNSRKLHFTLIEAFSRNQQKTNKRHTVAKSTTKSKDEKKSKSEKKLDVKRKIVKN